MAHGSWRISRRQAPPGRRLNSEEEAYMPLQVGDAAPDFNLKTAIGNEQGDFKLSNHQGRRVVIVFYALDFTPV